jgi:Cu(I)/Ag(I) efflux system membrane protein CusA/SilA
LSVGELLDVVGTALGGEMVTTTVEGRERFGVTVRYPRELRSNPEQIEREVLVPVPGGAMVPLGQVAKVVVARGTPGIRTENALLSAYIFVDIRDRDIGSYVADAKQGRGRPGQVPGRLLHHLERPVRGDGARDREDEDRRAGHAAADLPAAVPELPALTETLIVMLSVPFALVGGIWLMWWLGYNLSVAVAVGFIALAGVAAETGVVMLIYLDHAWEQMRANAAVPKAAAGTVRPVWRGDGRRGRAVRPKMMTVVAIMAGLLPIMWGSGTGSEVMSRIAAPMVGGMISSTVLTLCVIPALPVGGQGMDDRATARGRPRIALAQQRQQALRIAFRSASFSSMTCNLCAASSRVSAQAQASSSSSMLPTSSSVKPSTCARLMNRTRLIAAGP